MDGFVDAYDTRSGDKLPHSVPRHFVEELAHITGLARTPSGRDSDTAASAPVAEQTPAAVVVDHTDTEGH